VQTLLDGKGVSPCVDPNAFLVHEPVVYGVVSRIVELA